MYRSSIGGRDAARPHSGQVRAVYRHALVTLITPLLPSLAGGRGWSVLELVGGLRVALASERHPQYPLLGKHSSGKSRDEGPHPKYEQQQRNSRANSPTTQSSGG